MKIDRLQEKDLPELQQFLSELPLSVSRDNLNQFWIPRKGRDAYETGLLGLKYGDRLIGTLGYIQVPVRISGFLQVGRWPTNYFLLPEFRHKGLGQGLLDAIREPGQWGLVSGGTPDSIAVFEKSGWHLIGNLSSCRWCAPCMHLSRLSDRFRRGSRLAPPEIVSFTCELGPLSAKRVDGNLDRVLWAPEGPAAENGVPRNTAFLEFAFGFALRQDHAVYMVYLKEELVGYFVLAAQADRFPLLVAQIVDCDAVPGREAAVLWAASRTGLRCADIVRLRILGQRFAHSLARVPASRPGQPDVPFRILPPQNYHGEAHRSNLWRITYGDHDEYRSYPYTQRWRLENKD